MSGAEEWLSGIRAFIMPPLLFWEVLMIKTLKLAGLLPFITLGVFDSATMAFAMTTDPDARIAARPEAAIHSNVEILNADRKQIFIRVAPTCPSGCKSGQKNRRGT
jgi:hypothetical protein